MAELGRIERPAAEAYAKKKKLYCVPNVYPLHKSLPDYDQLLDTYWNEVTQQLKRLELAGKIRKVFCEGITEKEEEALAMVSRVNEKAHLIIKEKIEEGAVLVPLERDDLLGPFLDWSNCLKVVRTPDVFAKVFEFFNDVSGKRLEYIMETIRENISDGEAAMLILRDEDRVRLQFPPDIEVFLVTPPSYDDTQRWLRDRIKDLET